MLYQRFSHLGRMQHTQQHTVAWIIGVGSTEFIGGFMDAAHQFASEGKGVSGNEVAVDGEVGAGEWV
ncbi:hypothetical protein D3C77_759190 [compost metagenome]